jgi:hypothetical protein
MRPEPFIVGLDLGQSHDPTALAVLEREPVVDEAGNPARDGHGHPIADYSVLHLERYPLGSSYPDMVEKVRQLLARDAIQARGRPRLAIDATGVGRAVVDQFLGARLAATVVPITITAGAGVTKDLWNKTGVTCFRVAKLDLVASARIALDARRLKIVPTLALAPTLTKELSNYQVKITAAAHETFNAREGAYDDLVLACCLGVWLGDNHQPVVFHCLAGGERVPPARASTSDLDLARPPYRGMP